MNVAEARHGFTAVWSGTKMIVWGGCDAQTCGPGGNSDRFGLKNGGRCSRTQRQTDRPRSLLVLFVDRYDRSRSALRVFLVLLINQIHQLFVFRNAAWRGLYRGDDFVVIIDDTMVLITSRSRPR